MDRLTRRNTTGKASRRKRQQRSSSHGDRLHAAAAEVPAPDFDGTAVQAIRDALAMVTSVHASPQDLPGLAEELAADQGRQGLVAYALVSRFITESARELADARGITVPAVLEGITAGLETGDAEHHTALNRALATVRAYAEALDDLRPPGTLTAGLDANLGPGPASCRYLIALTQIAHEMITAHCAETGEDVASYLQRVSLPAAGAHGNTIDADTAGGYAGALIGDRLAAEPLLLNVAAQALRRGTLALPDEDAGEFRELGGSDRLDELAGDAWDDMDAEDQRLLAITLLESVLIDPGSTVLRPGFRDQRGALPLPCDVVRDKDVALTLRDGTTIYAEDEVEQSGRHGSPSCLTPDPAHRRSSHARLTSGAPQVIQGSGWGSAPRGCRGSTCMGRRGLRLRPRRGLGWLGDKNACADPMAQYGFEREGRRVQDLYLAGDRERAARALPAELIDTVSIYGPAEVVSDSLLADRDADEDALIVMPVAESTRTPDIEPTARVIEAG